MRLDPSKRGKKSDGLLGHLKSKIIGQDDASERVANAYQCYLAGLHPERRPISTMLFLGPTGVGKTRLVERLAEHMTGIEDAVIRIDCAEFQHSHEIAKIIGSPPGYLGHRETPALLSQETLKRHHSDSCKVSFVLFDEIEKASNALWNLLLGILDKATLTLGDNRRVDFSSSMVFLTSNLGAKDMAAASGRGLGFSCSTEMPSQKRLDEIGRGAARHKFTPEFMNRIDHVITFRSLSMDNIRSIFDLELDIVRSRLVSSNACSLCVTPAAKSWLIERGYSVEFGARHLKRTIDHHIVVPLSSLISSGQVTTGDIVKIGISSGEIVFDSINAAITASAGVSV